MLDSAFSTKPLAFHQTGQSLCLTFGSWTCNATAPIYNEHICSNLPNKVFTTLPSAGVCLILPKKQIREIFSNKASTNCLHRQPHPHPPSVCVWCGLYYFYSSVKCHTCQESEHRFSIVTWFCDGSCETFKTYRYFHKYPVSAQNTNATNS